MLGSFPFQPDAFNRLDLAHTLLRNEEIWMCVSEKGTHSCQARALPVFRNNFRIRTPQELSTEPLESACIVDTLAPHISGSRDQGASGATRGRGRFERTVRPGAA